MAPGGSLPPSRPFLPPPSRVDCVRQCSGCPRVMLLTASPPPPAPGPQPCPLHELPSLLQGHREQLAADGCSAQGELGAAACGRGAVGPPCREQRHAVIPAGRAARHRHRHRHRAGSHRSGERAPTGCCCVTFLPHDAGGPSAAACDCMPSIIGGWWLGSLSALGAHWAEVNGQAHRLPMLARFLFVWSMNCQCVGHSRLLMGGMCRPPLRMSCPCKLSMRVPVLGACLFKCKPPPPAAPPPSPSPSMPHTHAPAQRPPAAHG